MIWTGHLVKDIHFRCTDYISISNCFQLFANHFYFSIIQYLLSACHVAFAAVQ